MPEWMWSAAAALGALGMAACLYGMYASPKGFGALTALDPKFQSLDMRRRYTAEDVFRCFDGVGAEGQRLLAALWKLDFAFIAFFLMVMAVVSRNTAPRQWLLLAMLAAATLRALLDICENLLLLRVCAAYPARRETRLAQACGRVTALKWAAMAVWIVGLFAGLLMKNF